MGSLRFMSSLRFICLVVFPCVLATEAWAQLNTELPKAEYYVAKNLLGGGRTLEATQGFRTALTRARQVGEVRWIDSIPPHVMLGECYYRQGALADALEQYDAALMLAFENPRWIDQIENAPEQLPVLESIPKGINWFRKSQQTQPVAIPEGLQIAIDPTRAQVDPSGAVVAPVSLVTRLDTTEVLRTLGIAMLRRAQILGPMAKHSPLSQPAMDMFAQRPQQPIPWLQASWQVLQGISRMSNGRDGDAVNMIRGGLLIQNQFDHFLTPLGLIALGDIEAEQGNFQAAITNLQDASLLAAQYEQHLEMAWSLQLLGASAAASTRGELQDALQQAAAWSQNKSVSAYCNAMLSAAELAVYEGNLALAERLSKQAGVPLVQREISLPRTVAHWHYINALVGFGQDRSNVGTSQFDLALQFMQGSAQSGAVVEPVFQAQLALNLLASSNITAAQAEEILDRVLSEPSEEQWKLRPLHTIAELTTARLPAFERHLELAFARGDQAAILERADRLQREQFFESLPLGGRWLSWRELLTADPNELDQGQKRIADQAIQTRPELETIHQRIQGLLTTLQQGPPPMDTRQLPAPLRKAHEELQGLAQSYENQLAYMSLLRKPLKRNTPAEFDLASLQQQLGSDDLLLCFVFAGSSIVGLKVDQQEVRAWPILAGETVTKPLAELRSDLRLTPQNGRRPIDISAADAAWRTSVETIRDNLIPRPLQEEIAKKKRLIIVPHRQLWYLPFELLPERGGEPWLTSKRICYVPTLGMANHAFAPQRPADRTVGMTGKFFSTDADINRGLAEFVQAGMPDSKLIATNQKITVPSALWLQVYCDFFWSALGSSASPGQWDRPFMDFGNPQSSSFADLLQTPQRSPRQVFVSGMDSRISNVEAGNGNEIFMPACALMLGGTENAVLTRWAVGGKSTPIILRRYLEEQQTHSASASLRRAILALWPEELRVEEEPRLLPASKDASPLTVGANPLLWAGYMMIGDSISTAP